MKKPKPLSCKNCPKRNTCITPCENVENDLAKIEVKFSGIQLFAEIEGPLKKAKDGIRTKLDDDEYTPDFFTKGPLKFDSDHLEPIGNTDPSENNLNGYVLDIWDTPRNGYTGWLFEHANEPKPGSEKRNRILQHLKDGRSAEDIKYHEGCSKSYVRQVRRKKIAEASSNEHQQILQKMLNGWSYAEIAEQEDCTERHIKYLARKYKLVYSTLNGG